MSKYKFIDDDSNGSGTKEYYDAINNFHFTVRAVNRTTHIAPRDTQGLVELKIGLIMPYHQKGDELTRRLAIGGTSAIRLAMAEINTQKLFPGAYVTLVEQDSYPHEGPITQAVLADAVYAAVSLVQQGVIGIIGDVSSSWTALSASMSSNLGIPQCSFASIATFLSDKSQYGYFFRTAPTDLVYADAVLRFVASQGWPQLSIIFSDDEYGQKMLESITAKARNQDVRVRMYEKVHADEKSVNIETAINVLIKKEARIFFIAGSPDLQAAVLAVAGQMGHINKNTVWLTADLTDSRLYDSISQFNSILSQHANPTANTTHAPNATDTQNNTTLTATNSTAKPITYAAQARAVTNTTLVHYNSTFRGGVFSFETKSNLTGYAPFDAFMKKWVSLDSQIYPYAGTKNTTGYESMAYSCMMVLAQGYNKIVHNSSNTQDNIARLANGNFKSHLEPSTFNMSFIGPNGPVIFDQNGDNTVANFDVMNFQEGSSVAIGTIINDKLNLTQPPIFHDGTSTAPYGIPSKLMLNPGYGTPASIAIIAISGIGALIALVTMAIVLIYRKHDVFRVSSPLFCVLELIGFVTCYVSVFFFAGQRTEVTCVVIPITFHIGYALVLGNLIAKNYRIYRIFNNIYITGSVVRDYQLLKVAGSILLVVVVLLIAWFRSCDVLVLMVPVSRKTYFMQCTYRGAGYHVILYMLIVFGALLLAFATFLAFKTRSVGENYSKYSEYKQIGFSVYNIFFSALVGFIVFYAPGSDYYTRHYLTLAMIVWSTTFSLLVLFLPKLYRFFFPNQTKPDGKASDLTGREHSYSAQNALDVSERKRDGAGTSQTFGDLLDLEQMLNGPLGVKLPQTREAAPKSGLHRRHLHSKSGDTQAAFMETHEARVPIQRVFRYGDFLSAWEMKRIILMPKIAYFSCYSEKDKKGFVFAYSGSSVVTARKGAYVLRIHGLGWHDVLLQVSNMKEIECWSAWFNYGKTASDSSIRHMLAPSNTNLASETSRQQAASENRNGGHVTDGSGITTHNLLLDTNRASSATMETMDSCMYQPVLEIDDARTLSAVANSSIHPESNLDSAIGRPSSEIITPGARRSSFFSSFAAYLSSDETRSNAKKASRDDIALDELQKKHTP